MLFAPGDIIELDFNSSLEREPVERRPAIVVGSETFNVATSMTLVCPIAARRDSFPLHFDTPEGSGTYGTVAIERMRAFDLEARSSQFVESVGDSDDPALMDRERECSRSFF